MINLIVKNRSSIERKWHVKIDIVPSSIPLKEVLDERSIGAADATDSVTQKRFFISFFLFG